MLIMRIQSYVTSLGFLPKVQVFLNEKNGAPSGRKAHDFKEPA